MATCLQKNLFFTGKEDISIHWIVRLIGTWVLILPHFWWGWDYILLGIHHALVWNIFLQNNQRWWLQIMLWGLLMGMWRQRVLRVHGFFHLFESTIWGKW
jgi:hypothetical protein